MKTITLNRLILMSMSLVALLCLSCFAASTANGVYYSAANSTRYDKEDLTGAFRADLANISYTIDGASGSVLSLSSAPGNVRTIDRMILRSAFTIFGAVVLMDEYDQQIYDETGVEVFTAVLGTDFTSSNLGQYRNYFGGDSAQPRYMAGSLLNKTDGDDTGSNETLVGTAYSVTIDYENFAAPGFDGLNNSDHENLNTQYEDLTSDLLDVEEEEDDWVDSADRVLAGGFDNLESSMKEIMKKRVSELDEDKPYASSVLITNYTLTTSYLEQVMSEKLSDDILDAYDTAKSGGFLSDFKIESPLKLSRVSIGNPIDTFAKAGGNVRNAVTKTFDKVTGSTAWTNAVAFKDNVVKGAVSKWTGLKEKAHTAVASIKDFGSKIKTGTQKLISKAFGWFNGLSTKVQNIIKVVVAIVVLGLVVYLIFNLKMIMGKVKMFKKRR